MRLTVGRSLNCDIFWHNVHKMTRPGTGHPYITYNFHYFSLAIIWWVLVMSPIFSSARLVTFFTSARNWKFTKNELKFGFSIEDLFFIIFYNKLVLKMSKLCTFLLHKFKKRSIKLIEIMIQKQNWEIWKICFHIVSSVSARKLECPSSARLGNFTARLSSSRKIPARTHH
jgi:hypothetical protein